jgi:hypothetical protein
VLQLQTSSDTVTVVFSSDTLSATMSWTTSTDRRSSSALGGGTAAPPGNAPIGNNPQPWKGAGTAAEANWGGKSCQAVLNVCQTV